MIARLEGVLAEKTPERVVLDVGGVGYDVRVPVSTFLALPDTGKTVALRIHTYVREDAFHLYGFPSDEERHLFRLLLGISGVGPRMALAILSGLPLPKLVHALREGDRAALRGIPGVGPKTADRILVDLRDRVGEFAVSPAPEAPPRSDAEDATVSALVNLGYPKGHAEKAVRRALDTLGEAPELEALIREALRVAAG